MIVQNFRLANKMFVTRTSFHLFVVAFTVVVVALHQRPTCFSRVYESAHGTFVVHAHTHTHTRAAAEY